MNRKAQRREAMAIVAAIATAVTFGFGIQAAAAVQDDPAAAEAVTQQATGTDGTTPDAPPADEPAPAPEPVPPVTEPEPVPPVEEPVPPVEEPAPPVEEPDPVLPPAPEGKAPAPEGKAPAAEAEKDALVTPMATPGCAGWPVGTPAGFEIDGNLCTNGLLDWATVGGQPAQVDGSGQSDTSAFTGGSSESQAPAAWQTGTGVTPEMNDVTNVYAYSTTSGGDVYAFLGFERPKANGSIAYYVEFNQNGNLSGPRPDREVGDLRLTLDQTGNATISLVAADTWNGSSWVSLGSTTGFTGRVNQGDTANLADHVLKTGEFAEVVVNLTALFGEAGCSGAYGTLNVRSAASPSVTSALKDWVQPISLSVPSTCASVIVDKTWVIDGVEYADGAQPFGTADLTLTGQDDPAFGTTYTERSDGTDYEAGQSVTIGETVSGLPAGCTNVPSGDLGEHTLGAGVNAYDVTNTVTCTYLTLAKQVVGDADPASWTLAADGPTSLSGATGSADVTKVHVLPGDYTLTEADGPDGYQLTDLSCTPVAGSEGVVTVAAGDDVVCTFTNTAEVGLQVTKTWNVDGVTYADGDQPVGVAQLTLDGEDATFGTVYDGYLPGDEVVVAENVTQLPERCTLITTVGGTEGSSATHTITLTPDPNVVEVVNTVTCEQLLTLVKQVGHGDADPTLWTLTADGPGDPFSGSTGSPEVTDHPVAPNAPYELSEAGGPITYVQSGQWACVDDDTGTEVALTNGAVSVAYGASVTCTVTNVTATLTLLKHIADGADGMLSPEDWTLVAAPGCDVVGLAEVTVTGAETESAANTAEIRPDCEYTLAEEVDEGSTLAYRQTALERWDEESGTWVALAGDSISVAPGTHAIVRFVNDLTPAVVLPFTGGTSADAFTLSGVVVLLLALALVLWQWIVRRRTA